MRIGATSCVRFTVYVAFDAEQLLRWLGSIRVLFLCDPTSFIAPVG